MLTRRLALLPLLASSAACLDLKLDSDATTMTATTFESGETVVRICPGPALLACTGTGHYLVSAGGELEETSGPAPYSVTFTGAAPGSRVTIVRDDGATAFVTLPDPFEATASGNAITWSPSGSGDRMEVSSSRECGSDFSADAAHEIEDDGRLEVTTMAGCTTTYTLSRRRDGDVGKFVEGSTLVGAEERTVSF